MNQAVLHAVFWVALLGGMLGVAGKVWGSDPSPLPSELVFPVLYPISYPIPDPIPLKTGDPPAIASLTKPKTLKQVLEDREVVAHASLDDLPSDPVNRKYSFYTAMLVDASLKETYTVLTNYKLYLELVPFIEKSDYSPTHHTLVLEGSIWSFRLSSLLLFADRSDRWIHFDIIDGHFTGLSGNMYLESKGEKGTLVYMDGQLIGSRWPPKFIIEQGAEIVFGFTARRMRSYIETAKKGEQGAKHGEQGQQGQGQIPQPKGHF